jgi:signal transduction histidine kinase
MITGYPVVIRGEPVYFIFLSTPASSIYSQIEDTLFAQKVQTIILLSISASAISIVIIIQIRRNTMLASAVKDRTSELESASAKLSTSNNELEVRNQQLTISNRELAKKENELQKAITRVLEIDKEKSEFSAMITHELKTPLVSIIGYGSMFLNGSLGEMTPVQRQKLQIMFTDAERLAALIQDILDIQKLELGQLRLDIRRASARDIIEQSIS